MGQRLSTLKIEKRFFVSEIVSEGHDTDSQIDQK